MFTKILLSISRKLNVVHETSGNLMKLGQDYTVGVAIQPSEAEIIFDLGLL